MLVVAGIPAGVRELHRDAVAVLVLRARLAQDLERLDARDVREAPGGCKEVGLLGRSLRMREREDHGVPDSTCCELTHVHSSTWMRPGAVFNGVPPRPVPCGGSTA